MTSAQVALAWLLSKPGVTAPIVGSTKLRHLKDALAAEQLMLAETRSPVREALRAAPGSRPLLAQGALVGQLGSPRVERATRDRGHEGRADGRRFPQPGCARLRPPCGGGGRAGGAGLPRDASPTPSSRRGPGAWPWRSTTSVSARGARGHRQPQLGPVPHRFFGVSGYGRILVPINFRLTTDEIGYIVGHSGASVLLYDPELADEVDAIKVSHRFASTGWTTPRCSPRRPTARRGMGARRGRHLLDQLHVGHDGTPQGGAADASQLLAQRGHLRVAHRRERP